MILGRTAKRDQKTRYWDHCLVIPSNGYIGVILRNLVTGNTASVTYELHYIDNQHPWSEIHVDDSLGEVACKWLIFSQQSDYIKVYVFLGDSYRCSD